MTDRVIRKVLVVDDEEILCNIIVSFLEVNGFHCQGVTDPAKALEIIKDNDFDLVISDIRMNGMDGVELTREIRKTGGVVDVIIMSSFTDDYSYGDIIEAGAVDFIGKPLLLPELKAKIARVDRERKVLAELRQANEAIQCSLADTEHANERLRHEIEEKNKVEVELFSAHREIESLVSSIPLILIAVSNDGVIKRWNAVAEKVFQIDSFEALEMQIDKCPIPWDSEKIDSCLRKCFSESIALTLQEVRFKRAGREDGLLDLTISPIRGDFHHLSGFIIVGADVSEQALLKRQLVQSQKLESIGQLAAGIAHEINTPTQYVGDNIRFLHETFGSLEKVHILYSRLLDCLRSGNAADDLMADIEATMSEADLDYIRDEIPIAINQSLEGINRISNIVRSMKEFSHPGSDHKTGIDINRAIENTIAVARNEWKYVSDVFTDFDSSLPPVHCLPGEFNQVILNMIVNSAHAISEKLGGGSVRKGTVRVSTRMMGELVEIRISDNGNGIREDIKSKIFDPFFTTKDVGKGTGQGLAIAHSVIVKKHGGAIDFESKPGEGTTFVITLPIRGV
jgi:signal transduction histidine kinase/DNA-binding response OmpR family regulator